jgi:hypothetical protein
MDYAHYFSAMTVFGLQGLRRQGDGSLERIKTVLRNITLDQTVTQSESVMTGEIPGKEHCSWQDWIFWLRDQDCRDLRCFQVEGRKGVLSAEKGLAWMYGEEQSPLMRITGRQFLDFIDLQKSPGDFRKAVLASVSNYSQSNFNKTVSNKELADFFLSPECPVFFELNGESFWYELREKYVTPERTIIIPPDYETLILEEDDSYFEGRRTWSFVENTKTWTAYSFRLVPLPGEVPGSNEVDLESALRLALEGADSVAVKIESPYHDAFTTALSLLELASQGIPLVELVMNCKTTEEGRGIVGRQSSVLRIFEDIGVDAVTIGQLLACEAGDVFGGMGSWNDQSVPPELQEDFMQCSRDLFSALDHFRTDLIR